MNNRHINRTVCTSIPLNDGQVSPKNTTIFTKNSIIGGISLIIGCFMVRYIWGGQQNQKEENHQNNGQQPSELQNQLPQEEENHQDNRELRKLLKEFKSKSPHVELDLRYNKKNGENDEELPELAFKSKYRPFFINIFHIFDNNIYFQEDLINEMTPDDHKNFLNLVKALSTEKFNNFFRVQRKNEKNETNQQYTPITPQEMKILTEQLKTQIEINTFLQNQKLDEKFRLYFTHSGYTILYRSNKGTLLDFFKKFGYNKNISVDLLFRKKFAIYKTGLCRMGDYEMAVDDKKKLYHMLEEILKSKLINEDYKESFNGLLLHL